MFAAATVYAAAMSTKKQREKEQRYRRHGVERPRSPQIDQKQARGDEEPATKRGKRGSSHSSAAARPRKPVPYPTLFRALSRAPIFGILWFVLFRFILSKQAQDVSVDIYQALILTGVMIPLLFVTDTVTYRLSKRRGVPLGERPSDGWIGFPGR